MAREHTPEERAAVLAALMAGQSISSVAREHNLTRNTVRNWWLASGMNSGSPVITQEKRVELGDKLTELLQTILTTLCIQAEQFRDPTWVKQQPASEIAVLFGVMADKAFRILEAASTGEDTEP